MQCGRGTETQTLRHTWRQLVLPLHVRKLLAQVGKQPRLQSDRRDICSLIIKADSGHLQFEQELVLYSANSALCMHISNGNASGMFPNIG